MMDSHGLNGNGSVLERNWNGTETVTSRHGHGHGQSTFSAVFTVTISVVRI